jgi:tartrate-resistant acid phosphatase type 5
MEFISIADWGCPGVIQHRVAAAMAKEKNAKFVIAVGDNFYEDGVESTRDILWTRVWKNVYHQLPWYVCLGNHDYRKNPDAQIEYSKLDENWIMPNLYYNFIKQLEDGSRCNFIMIDTQHLDDKSPISKKDVCHKHMLWLKDALKNNTCEWVIVCGHAPLYSVGIHGGNSCLRSKLNPLFQKHGVDMYISGHNHNIEHTITNYDMHHIVTGTASKTRPVHYVSRNTIFSTDAPGYTKHSFVKTNDRMSLVTEMKDTRGQMMHRFTMYVPRQKKKYNGWF